MVIIKKGFVIMASKKISASASFSTTHNIPINYHSVTGYESNSFFLFSFNFLFFFRDGNNNAIRCQCKSRFKRRSCMRCSVTNALSGLLRKFHLIGVHAGAYTHFGMWNGHRDIKSNQRQKKRRAT